MYDGDMTNLGITIDSNMAMDWWAQTNKDVEIKDIGI